MLKIKYKVQTFTPNAVVWIYNASVKGSKKGSVNFLNNFASSIVACFPLIPSHSVPVVYENFRLHSFTFKSILTQFKVIVPTGTPTAPNLVVCDTVS